MYGNILAVEFVLHTDVRIYNLPIVKLNVLLD